MKKFIQNNKLKLKVIFVFILMTLAIVAIFYPLMPKVLNYPDGTYNNEFQWELEHANYTIQFIEITLAIVIIYTVLVFIKLSFLNKLDDAKKNNDVKQLSKIRNKLFKVPDELYMLQVFIPSIGVPFLYAFSTGFIGITTIKVFIIYMAFITLVGTFSIIFVRREFSKLLSKIDLPLSEFERKASLISRMRYQIIPLIIVALMFTSLLGYSLIIYSESNIAYDLYKTKLNNSFAKEYYYSMDEVNDEFDKMELQDNSIVKFIIYPDGSYKDLNGQDIEFSDFWKKYTEEFSIPNDSMIYDYYGFDIRGAIKKINIGNEGYYVGVQYNLASRTALIALAASMISLFILNLFTLQISAKSLASEVHSVSEGMENIVRKLTINDNLPVTSNDEIGELIVAFNKVQELTKENIIEIKNSEQTLMEKERLASLGELIGGIAHNMKTPIMSTAGAAEGLVELIAEYRASIDNPQVTSEDHKEIAKDMLEWVTKIKSYNSYMSDIITTVKGQASQLSSSENEKFTLYDLSKRVEILIKHEIKKANLVLDTKIECDPSITLSGDVNSLIQVINNLISNSIYAYQGVPDKVVEFILDYDEYNKNVILKVVDEGCGMNEETKSKLFKQMYTTKGKNGTGLGLYMSYSTIRGKFNGTMAFESEEGKGTTFIITIPKK